MMLAGLPHRLVHILIVTVVVTAWERISAGKANFLLCRIIENRLISFSSNFHIMILSLFPIFVSVDETVMW